jgi:hypothetical protein
MAKRKPPPRQWKGDEVEDAPDSTAEQGAERAEGNTPISVADAAKRASDDEDVGELPRPARDALSPEEKIAEVAEEHRARVAAGDRGRGKL